MYDDISPETIKVIENICKTVSVGTTFDVYDEDDIFQELFMMCLEALPRYDSTKSSLDGFMYIHASNKLKTLIRDKYYNDKSNKKRKKFFKQVGLDKVQHPTYEPDDDELDNKMIFEIIDREIPQGLRRTYLKLKDGSYIPKAKREELFDVIREILAGHGYNTIKENEE